jgi:tetratricopeptide (TPR) repeat protein
METYDEALTSFQLVLALQRSCKCSPIEITWTLQKIGEMHRKQNNLEEASEVMQECLCMRREALGDVHDLVANSLTDTAVCFQQMNKLTLALELMHEAYHIFMLLAHGEANASIWYSSYFLGLYSHRQGDMDAALMWLLRSENVAREHVVLDHDDLAFTCYAISDVLSERGDLDSAVDYLQQSLASGLKSFGVTSDFCADVFTAIGRVELRRCNLESAMSHFSQALRIHRELYPGAPLPEMCNTTLWRFEVSHPPAAGAA